MDAVEAEGRTVNEATEQALGQLGLRRDEVDVEVLSEGRPRILGFGGEPARVRVTPRPVFVPPARPAPLAVESTEAVLEDEEDDEEYDEDEDEEYEEGDEDEDDEEYDEDEDEEEGDEPQALPPELVRPPISESNTPPLPVDSDEVRAAVTTLETLLQHMGVEASVTPREPETAGDGLGMIESVLDIDGEDLGILIGRRGMTLVALQYLLNLMVSKQVNRRIAIGVDVDGYRRRREEALVGLARRMASRVRTTGRSVTLEPMPPNERRIVHITLASDPAVLTVSIGEGESRKVAITPSR